MKRSTHSTRTKRPPRVVTREQIAQAAGTSPAAVSSFYNDRYYAKDRRHGIGLSAQTRQRILDASRALRYQPLEPAWRVRLYPEVGDFCFLLSQSATGGFANEYFSRMVVGVMRRLAGPPSRHLVCDQFDDDLDYLITEDALPGGVRAGTASRFLLAGAPNYSLLGALARSGFPVVYLSRYIALPGVCSVVPDFASASLQAIEHLVAFGHRQIAVVAPHHIRQPAGWNWLEFARGVTEAMSAARLPFAAEQDIIVLPDRDARQPLPGADEILAGLLARQPAPTAVFCLDDWSAMEIQRAAQRAGLALPGALSIVGCNNHHGTASLHPALTTIDIPGEELGATGYDALETMRRDGLPTDARRIVLPVRLIERESSVAPGAAAGGR